MMTEDRIAELRAKVRSYGRYSSYWVGIGEMLDEIERLKADHDASVTRWTIFLAEQRAEIERLQAKVDAAADYIAALRSGDPRREYCGKKYYAIVVGSNRLAEQRAEIEQLRAELAATRKPGSHWLPDDDDEDT